MGQSLVTSGTRAASSASTGVPEFAQVLLHGVKLHVVADVQSNAKCLAFSELDSFRDATATRTTRSHFDVVLSKTLSACVERLHGEVLRRIDVVGLHLACIAIIAKVTVEARVVFHACLSVVGSVVVSVVGIGRSVVCPAAPRRVTLYVRPWLCGERW
jgi:hypothetical protein